MEEEHSYRKIVKKQKNFMTLEKLFKDKDSFSCDILGAKTTKLD